MDTRAEFTEFSKNVETIGVAIYWGDRSFKMASNGEEPLTDDGTEGILTAIDSNILIEKVMVEWLRDWFSS